MGKRMEQQKKTKFDVAFLKAKENIIISQKHVPCKHSANNSTPNLLVLRDKRASHSIYIIDIDIDCFTSGKNNLCTMLLLVLQFKKIDYVLALGTASSELICTTSFCLQKIYWLRPMNEKKKKKQTWQNGTIREFKWEMQRYLTYITLNVQQFLLVLKQSFESCSQDAYTTYFYRDAKQM